MGGEVGRREGLLEVTDGRATTLGKFVAPSEEEVSEGAFAALV